MSRRLGRALARHIAELPGESKFVKLEGVPQALAEGLSGAWSDQRHQLQVVSDNPQVFPKRHVARATGAALRNKHAEGYILVVCEGCQIADPNSVAHFTSVTPGDLLSTSQGIAYLASQEPPVPLDGPARAVRTAITASSPADRPSAFAVSEYFDAVAAGSDPLEALPILGAFVEKASAGKVDQDRIGDNFRLAARRTSEDILRPNLQADLRQRAGVVLARRPGLRDAAVAQAVDRLIAQLQQGSDDLLREVSFDEAREILEQKAQDLAGTVIEELKKHRNELDPESQAVMLPWDAYISEADGLRRTAEQKPAARSLLELDSAQQPRIFYKKTRAKLERLLRDRAISSSTPSCPELGFIKAIEQLGGSIRRVQLIGPQPPVAASASRSAAGNTLTLAAARLRLGALMRHWEAQGADVPALLMHPATDGDPLNHFGDADWRSRTPVPPLQLRLHGEGATVQVDWRPDLDDLALLKSCLLFGDSETLTIAMDTKPTLPAFISSSSFEPQVPPKELAAVAAKLNAFACRILERGVEPGVLAAWADDWASATADIAPRAGPEIAEMLSLAGAVTGVERTAALTPLAPLKAEWLGQHVDALWEMLERTDDDEAASEPIQQTAEGVARTTAAHYPAHLKLRSRDRVLLPTSEGRIWSTFGTAGVGDPSGHAGRALAAVLERLLHLQPEAAGHLRCLAWGTGAADILLAEVVPLIGTRVGRGHLGKVEVFCVGDDRNRPSADMLSWAELELKGGRSQLELRYVQDLKHAADILGSGREAPAVHLALVTGLTEGGQRLTISTQDVIRPAIDDEVLFAPRTWQRPRQDRRTLLMPPAVTEPGLCWLRLQNAADEEWPERDDFLRIPEIRTGTLDIAKELREVHDLAMWVATLDRYATRDSLEQALGPDNIAILHQERRLGGDSPLSLVLSQKSGGPADRAIGRSLRIARIIDDPDIALSIGTDIRKVASQGYGILALQAATSGAGINELVGHVVAFSLLARTTTPWPLPPGCRVLLVSLDEYRHWFPGKRADLLAIALDAEEGGVHIAAIEVKARRSDETEAASGALDQLVQTLAATQWAAYPRESSLHSRLWLNRIAEAAYSVARESRFKLDAAEIDCLESFRTGHGTLEWAGVGLVFGPNVDEFHRHHQKAVSGDIVPIAMHGIRLTEQLLRAATGVRLTDLRTVEADRPPLQGGRVRRRPESRAEPAHAEDGAASDYVSEATDAALATNDLDDRTTEWNDDVAPAVDEAAPQPANGEPLEAGGGAPQSIAQGEEFVAPVLGWDASTGEELRWHAAGPTKELQNGHVEIWGSSGMGKTQFTMCLLAQLAGQGGTRFGIADFKNDYSTDTGFPQATGADFLDLWLDGASYNPLALYGDNERAIETAVIEVRDTIEEALRNLGRRQRSKLEAALREAYEVRTTEGRWPTFKTLHDVLDDDLAGILGDLTRHGIFGDGPPLGEVIDRNVVFGLSRIPGNGQTTVLSAAFILSSILLKVQNLPPVPNLIRYMCVVDEAHRVSDFKAVETMIREGRSKGLGVLLATQQPLDLPDIVAGNAQTKICFGLPDATVATMAARRLQPDNHRLAEQIRTLGVGEAFVALRGEPPRLVKMAQHHAHAAELGLSPLAP